MILGMVQYDRNQPIAIVGMGCQFPGGRQYDEYWENIRLNRCFIENLSDDSDVGRNFSQDSKEWNRSSTRLCARIQPFDFPFRRFKGLTPHSINLGYFYIQYSLIAAQDAIDDAGEKVFENIRGDTFVAVGHYNYETKAVRHFADSALKVFFDDLRKSDAFQKLSKQDQDGLIEDIKTDFFNNDAAIPHETIIASMGPAVAAKLTKVNKLNGGFTAVDSACASSLAALDIAVRRLRDGSSKAAVVGGIGVVSPYFYVHCSKAHAMSNEGSFPFSRKASGFVVGEGAGFVVIKTLSEALKNGMTSFVVFQALLMEQSEDHGLRTQKVSLAL